MNAPSTRVRPAASEVAREWAKAQKGLNAKTEALYATLWGAWLLWLAGRGAPWYEVRAADLRAFLYGAPPGQSRRRPPKDLALMSKFTRQRYWRVLDAIYRHADLADPRWLPEGWPNPAHELAEVHGKPEVDYRSRVSEVLPPGVLSRLRSPQELAKLLPQDSDGAWIALRDRAIMALLVHCALTSGELIALKPTDLREGAKALGGRPEPALPGMAADSIRVDIAAHGAAPQRALDIPVAAWEPLFDWLQARAQLEGVGDDSPLFVPRMVTTESRPPLEASSLFKVVRRCVLQAARDANATAGKANAHGPGVVRNSVLQLWLTRMDEEKVARLAGLKSVHSLRMPRLTAG